MTSNATASSTAPSFIDTHEVFPLRLSITFTRDWHISDGAGIPGSTDRMVRRSASDQLPYVPAKSITGVWRDACEQIIEALSDHQQVSDWVRYIFGGIDESTPEHPAQQAPTASNLSVQPAYLPDHLRKDLKQDPNHPERQSVSQAMTFIKPGIAINPDTGMAEDKMLRFDEVVIAGATLHADAELKYKKKYDIKSPQTQEANTAEADSNEVIPKFALALLWAGALLVEQMGHKRRRGLGGCRWQLTSPVKEIHDFLENDVMPYWESLSESMLMAPPPFHDAGFKGKVIEDINTQKTTSLNTSDTLPQPHWIKIPLQIQTLTPVICPDKTLGNTVSCLDHIPGTVLLSALNGRLKNILGQQLYSYVVQGKVKLHNAYPGVLPSSPNSPVSTESTEAWQRTLPVPMAWHRAKEKNIGTQVIETPSHQQDENDVIRQEFFPYWDYSQAIPNDRTQRKQWRQGYILETPCAVKTETFSTERLIQQAPQTKWQSTTHATLEDQHQRPTANVGGVFTYQAFSADQTFVSELWIESSCLPKSLETQDPEILNQTMSSLLDGEYRVGIAKKDDYGKVQLRSQRATTLTSDDTSPALLDENSEHQRLCLWLTSPLLIRDPLTLMPSTNPEHLREALEQHLNIVLDPIENQDASTPTAHSLFTRTHRDEGFQRQWGLPRQSRVGFSAGSIFCWQIKSAHVNAQTLNSQLQALQHTGFGERRAEGYGELRVNSPILSSFTQHQPAYYFEGKALTSSEKASATKDPATEDNLSSSSLTEADLRFNQQLIQRAWRSSMKEHTNRLMDNDAIRREFLGCTPDAPSNRQLGLLMSQLSQPEQQHLNVFIKWLSPIGQKNKDSLKQKFEEVWSDWPPKAQECLKALQHDLMDYLAGKAPKQAWTWIQKEAPVHTDDKQASYKMAPEFLTFPSLGIDKADLQKSLGLEAIQILWLTALQKELLTRTRALT